MLRLALALGRTPGEVLRDLTALDLSLFQALVEIDGPWWGEREAAHLRQLASVQAAAAGADLPPDRFEIEWAVGPREAAGPDLLPPADGLALFAGRHGLDLVEVPA